MAVYDASTEVEINELDCYQIVSLATTDSLSRAREYSSIEIRQTLSSRLNGYSNERQLSNGAIDDTSIIKVLRYIYGMNRYLL